MKKIIILISFILLVSGCGKEKIDYKQILLDEHYTEYSVENFFTAVVVNDYKVVELFLKEGMDPDTLDTVNRRMIYSAIGSDCIETINLLFEYGAEPNYTNEYDVNYLYFAAINSQSCETIKALVNGGVDLYYIMPSGSTVLDSVNGQYKENYPEQIKCLNDLGLTK